MTVLLVIVILVFLIVVHELGHFVAAKLSGVKVEEFGVGYPPRAFTFGHIGGTEYTLNWIPFGGFVRLFGDEGTGQRGRGSLLDAPRWKQAMILVAGVVMNALAALALFAIALHLGVPQEIATLEPGLDPHLVVTDLVAGSPAAAGGIALGDEIVQMTDERGEHPASETPEAVVDFVRTRGGKPISVDYLHAGEAASTRVIPANAIIPGQPSRAGLGIGLALVAVKSLPWGQALTIGGAQTVAAFGSVAHDLASLVGGVLHGAPDLSGVVGPVGIVRYVGEASQNGFGSVLILAALISVNLAIINLIPIPALDGGRLLILVIEMVMRKSAPRLAVQVLNAVGIALIVVLMVTVTYHDIARLLVA